MKCQHCGTELQSSWNHCPICASEPNNIHMSAAPTQYVALTSNKSKKTALVLCCLGFLGGILGITAIHRIYVGKIYTGFFLLLLNLSAVHADFPAIIGFLLFITIIDLIQIVMGQFTDNVGQPLRR